MKGSPYTLWIAAAMLVASAVVPPLAAQQRVAPAGTGSRAGADRGSSRTVARPAPPGTGVTRPAGDRHTVTPAERGRVIAPATRRPADHREHWGGPRYRDRYDDHRYGGTYYGPRPWRHGGFRGHHGLYVGAHFGSAFVVLVTPAVYPVYTYVAPYSVRYSASGARTLLQGDLGDAADAVAVERLSSGVVRLTWRPDGRAVEEIGLFLTDAQQNVLAVQTLRVPPFSALFEPTNGVAYVGVTIAYADGQSTTTLLPYRPRSAW